MSVLERFKLDGKTALVTGGAGLYGRQITEALAQAGARTYIASRNRDQSERLASELRDDRLNVNSLTLDQSNETSIEELKNTLLEDAERIDVLVNNAVLRPVKDWNCSADDFSKSMQVNATGLFLMTRTFGELMAEQGGGSIINIGSIQGHVGPDFSLYEGLGWETPPDYFFHKGGMLNFTRFAAAKLGPRNVRVNIISPGANGEFDRPARSRRFLRVGCFGIHHRRELACRRRLYGYVTGCRSTGGGSCHELWEQRPSRIVA